jgi:DNA-binding response OmpR family regulator
VYVSQPLRKLHVLLVDSDLYTCKKVQRALENDFVLQCVHSLEAAEHTLAEYAPDVLISEIVLLDASGLDLCRRVRRSPELRHLPIMLLTTLSTFQDKIAGFEAGADDYVVKPFDASHLIARIRLLARIKRLETEHN